MINSVTITPTATAWSGSIATGSAASDSQPFPPAAETRRARPKADRRRSLAAAQTRQPAAFIGRSKDAARVRDTLERLCQIPLSSVIISGETGTGKGLAARSLHHSGTRANGPLVEINCAALPRDLVESELFGHEAGAFTGAKGSHRGFMEQASEGTLFLDEIGELNFDLQAKLLKALEDKAIRRVGGERMIPNVHVVVEQPQSAGASGRKSLPGGSLSPPQVFHLDLPPLRVRKANIDEIVDGLIREFNAIAGKRVKRVPEAVRALLAAYVERSVLLSTGKELPAEWLQITPGGSLATTMASGDVISLPLDGSMSFDTMEKLIVEAALQRDGYNVMAAARRLGPKSSPAGWSITSARVTSSRSSPRCCFSR